MVLFLRTQRAQDVIEGRAAGSWKEDDFSVVDGIKVGRIYRELRPDGERWCWFLHVHGASPNTGAEASIEKAKKALADAYEIAGGIRRAIEGP
jgi:hypothetical protein